MDGCTDGWMDGVDGWIAGRTNGWIVRRCYTELVTPANNRATLYARTTFCQ